MQMKSSFEKQYLTTSTTNLRVNIEKRACGIVNFHIGSSQYCLYNLGAHNCYSGFPGPDYVKTKKFIMNLLTLL